MVDGAVEERAVVVGPSHGCGALDGEADVLSGGEVAHLHGELGIRSGLVVEVGRLAVVRADDVAAEDEGLLTGRQFIDVEDHLLGGIHRSLAAAVGAVLLALLGAAVIVIAVVVGGITLVVLLDAAQDLVVDLLL